MLADLQNARFTTKYYHALKGLVLVPTGIYLVLFSIGDWLEWQGFQQGNCTLHSVFLPIVILLTLAASRYYRKRFGEVRRPASTRELWAAVIGVAVWFLLAMADMIWLGDISFSFTTLGWAFFCAMIPTFSEGKRGHYYLLAAGLVCFAFFPTLNILSKMDLFSGRWLGNLAIGAALVIGGLLDHWMLIRLFARVKEAHA